VGSAFGDLADTLLTVRLHCGPTGRWGACN